MLQIVEQNDKDKFEMYNKLSKKDIIKMLIQANKIIDSITPIVSYEYCQCMQSSLSLINGKYICNTCNKPSKYINYNKNQL